MLFLFCFAAMVLWEGLLDQEFPVVCVDLWVFMGAIYFLLVFQEAIFKICFQVNVVRGSELS